MPTLRCLLLLLVLPAALPARAAPAADPPRRRSWGTVTGWILDARTRRPIPAARAAVELDGVFPAQGRGTGTSDQRGRYRLKAPLGRISSRFDWGRLLTMHPISLLISPASVTKQTRILDAGSLVLRVEAAGYRPFLGRVRAARQDPAGFSVALEDVWLAPAGSALVSFSPEGVREEAIEGLSVEPAVARPGDRVRITLTARLPLHRDTAWRAYAFSSAPRVVEGRIELKRQEPLPGAAGPADRVLFSREVTLPRAAADAWTEIGCQLTAAGEAVPVERAPRVILQMLRDLADVPAADQVARAHAALRSGDLAAGLERLAAARASRPDYPLAYLLQGDLYLRLGRPAEAVEAYRRLVELEPHDYEIARARHLQALLECGRREEAGAALETAQRSLGRQRTPAPLALCRARILAYRGEWEEADRALVQAGQGMEIPAEVTTELNRMRLETALAAAPESADLRASLGRMLLEMGRADEARGHLREVARREPDRPWAYIDLAASYRDRPAEALPLLRHAAALDPDNPVALLALADALRDLGRYAEALPHYRRVAGEQKLNFHARHSLALMLFATGQVEEARRELAAVVLMSRDKGELRESGLPLPGLGIYFGPKRRLVAGYSSPEAAADALLLESLVELEKRPGSALAWQGAGAALLELRLPAAAAAALEKSLSCAPELLETRFLLGSALLRAESWERAQAELEAVLRANPLHPRVRRELAALHAARGDTARAQELLLERPDRPEPGP